MPVKIIARPASSAAAITSASRIEPPGWMTAVAPASAAASRPSANGKKASDATAEPTVRGSGQPFASAASRARMAAIGQLLFARLALGNALELFSRDPPVVAILDQQAAGDHCQGLPPARRVRQ